MQKCVDRHSNTATIKLFFYLVPQTNTNSYLSIRSASHSCCSSTPCSLGGKGIILAILTIHLNATKISSAYKCLTYIQTACYTFAVVLVTQTAWFQDFAVFCMLYAFFWVIPRHLEFICRCFGTLCLFHLHRQADVSRILLTSTCLWRWNRQCVLKRWHINSRRQGITQKKAYNITCDYVICETASWSCLNVSQGSK